MKIFILHILFSALVFAQAKLNPLKPQPQLVGRYPIETLFSMDKISHSSGQVIINEKGQWKVQLRIGFVGAYHFSLTTEKEKNELNKFLESQALDIKFPPDDSFFNIKSYTKNGSVSLAHNPIMKNTIEKQMKAISTLLSSTQNRLGIDFTFEIIPVFIDETDLYKKIGISKVTRSNVGDLAHYFMTQKLKFHPITILPVPNEYAVSPDYWDLYARPEYLAHETIHLITRDMKNDQFIYSDAPFDGLTNDGSTFRELEKMGFQPQLDKSLFLAFVQNQKALENVFGPQKGAFISFSNVFKKYMSATVDGSYSEEPADWERNFESKKQKYLLKKDKVNRSL